MSHSKPKTIVVFIRSFRYFSAFMRLSVCDLFRLLWLLLLFFTFAFHNVQSYSVICVFVSLNNASDDNVMFRFTELCS